MGSHVPKFPLGSLYTAALMYYEEDATQADIARRLGTSRATVSRLLSEARRVGIVNIEVRPPAEADEGLASALAERLGLRGAYVGPVAPDALVGATLGPAVSAAVKDAGLEAGDVLLTSSGRAVWSAAKHLPPLPGVLVTPTVGGQNEAAPWYQTNEITRVVAEKIGGHPVFLHAPAVPGPDLYDRLLDDDSIRGVLDMWDTARCALLGVGAPPAARESLPGFVDRTGAWTEQAVGDICARFYGQDGQPVDFPGSDRLIATDLDQLRRVPVTIAIAAGAEKTPSIRAGARAGWFNTLVTDTATAHALLE